jgi:hypothetical protein
MIVVIVREQDEIDRWQCTNGKRGWDDASWTKEAPGRRALPPDWISQEVQRAELHQQRRVPYPGNRDLVCGRPR